MRALIHRPIPYHLLPNLDTHDMSSDQTSLEIKAVPPSAVFHAFTFCIPLEEQPLPLLLDTRDYKAFKQNHIMQSYCVRVGGEGRALLDYSKSKYTVPWSKDCWCV